MKCGWVGRLIMMLDNDFLNIWSYRHGCHEGGAGGCSGPPLESELSFICIGFSLINDVRARVWPPPGKGGPPLENFLVTPMPQLIYYLKKYKLLQNFTYHGQNCNWPEILRI